MELLFTPSKPQKYMNLLDPIARLEIPKVFWIQYAFISSCILKFQLLTHSPQEHYRFTRDMVAKKMEYDTDPFMREMGVSCISIKNDRNIADFLKINCKRIL